MSPAAPSIVTSLPARSLEALGRQVGLAVSAGADLAEVRVDRLPPAERAGLAGLFPSPLPLLATYRSRAEGGDGAEDPGLRREILLELARLPFRWVDLELRRDLAILPELPPAERLGRIISVHPGPGSVRSWEGCLRELGGVEGIGKLVVPATLTELFEVLVPLLDRSRDSRRVVHTTGPSGPLLRALAREFGFPFVFASLPEASGEAAVEASQVPLDRLRPFVDGPPRSPLFAVAGRPVLHSRSPAVHSAWMRAEGRSGLFVALEPADEQEFVRVLPALAAAGFRGLNVTHPFKRAALETSGEIRPGASACGAANCLSFQDGAVVGENTDLSAVLRRLEELRGSGRWDGRSLTVLGAGGAARATLAAARLLTIDATIAARRPAAAQELAREFGARVLEGGPGRPAGLLVHATTVGRAGAGELAVRLDPLLGPGTHVLDWVYAPDRPLLRVRAERAGATYEDGWRLFVYQAAASYALWWGSAPSTELLSAALREGGCAA